MLMLGAFFCMMPQAQAAVQEISVTGIGVHQDIEQAQKLAADYAKKRALYLLARKWGVHDLEAKLSRLDNGVIQQSIRGIKQLDFKREGDVLFVKSVVSVLDTPLKRMLKVPLKKPVQHAQGIGVLVVPVFKDGAQLLVFDRSNPLRAPLRRAALMHGNQLVVVPLGDSNDLRVIDYDNILQARYDTFEPLLERYGAKEVLVALITAPDSHSDTTQVLVNRLYAGGMKPQLLDIKAKDPTNMAARYADISQVLVSMALKRAASTSQSEQQARDLLTKQSIAFAFTTMQEYGKLDAILREAPEIENITIGQIGLQHVSAEFYHRGNLAAIAAYLEKKGVKLREKGGIWILSMR
jgi:hypothetical protein